MKVYMNPDRMLVGPGGTKEMEAPLQWTEKIAQTERRWLKESRSGLIHKTEELRTFFSDSEMIYK
jgi:hypothetical protein